MAELPILSFTTLSAWETWLAKNHATSAGIWMKLSKKAAAERTITYDQAVEGALCYGWIDSQKKSFDANASLQRFTPRSPKSVWPKINTERVARLIQSGRMQPAGRKLIEAAKKCGSWDKAYAPQSQLQVPPDLIQALEKNAKAKTFFATLNRVNIYAIVYRLQSAKNPQTREKRLKHFIEMLARGEKLHP